MPKTHETPACVRGFAGILEVGLDTSEYSEARHPNQPLSGGTAASRALAKDYRERRKNYPIHRRTNPGKPQIILTEAF